MSTASIGKNNKEYIITSSDLMLLMRFMLGADFTVVEKNRFRRHPEVFCPRTVSKQVEDSREFFHLIMELPEPKPRKGKKDINVFRWSHLDAASWTIVDTYVQSMGPNESQR